MKRREPATITWGAKEIVRRLQNPAVLARRRSWTLASADGRPALLSAFGEQPPHLVIQSVPKGRYAVTLHLCCSGEKNEFPGTLRVESADAPGRCVVTSRPEFFLGVWDLSGAPLTITKANLGRIGISAVSFEKRTAASPYFSRDSIRRSPMMWGICDQSDFAVESVSSDIANFEPMVRYHRELGFNIISWHMCLGCCEYPTRVGTTFPLINVADKEHLRMLAEHRRAPYVDVIWREFVSRHDCLAEGIRLAHREGLKFFPCFRMNNEWAAKWCEEFATPEFLRTFWQPEFFKKHPECWNQYKSGAPTGGGMDYSHAAVRRYRLAFFTEVMENYPDIDGIFLDLHRHPPMVTYPDKVVAAFQRRYGVNVRKVRPVKEETMDPRWLKFRARHFTTFMRSVKREKERLGKKYPTAVRTEKTLLECLREGADLEVWFKEGLVDILILERYRNETEASLAPIAEAASRAGVKVLGGFPYLAGDRKWEDVRKQAETWLDEGASGIAVYESNDAVCGPLLRRHWPEWVASLK